MKKQAKKKLKKQPRKVQAAVLRGGEGLRSLGRFLDEGPEAAQDAVDQGISAAFDGATNEDDDSW